MVHQLSSFPYRPLPWACLSDPPVEPDFPQQKHDDPVLSSSGDEAPDEHGYDSRGEDCGVWIAADRSLQVVSRSSRARFETPSGITRAAAHGLSWIGGWKGEAEAPSVIVDSGDHYVHDLKNQLNNSIIHLEGMG